MVSKTQKNKLTVVIPTNRVQFLDQAIASALNQEGASCQVLVVDDGAMPSIESQIKIHSGDVMFVRHSQNRGLPASRNTGVKNTETDYLTFLDCDDLLEPGFAKEMIEACKRFKTGAVVCLPHFFFSPGFPLKKRIFFSFLSLIRDAALLLSYFLNGKFLPKDGFFLIQFSHVIFQKELLRRFLSDETYLTAANDWKLMAEILAREKVGILPKKLSRYRYHHRSQTQSKNKILKWLYYDKMLKEIPQSCRKGMLITLFRIYNFLGKMLSQY